MRSLRIILTLAGKDLLVLWRMPAILAVIFLPGIVMYTVFTLIFAGPAGRPFRAAVVDLDRTEASAALIRALEESNVTVVRTVDESAEGAPLTVESARAQIRGKGQFRVAVVIPEGYSKAPTTLSGTGHVGVQLIHDETQPMEADAVAGMLQMAAGRQLSAAASRTFGRLFGFGGRDAPTTTKAESDAGAPAASADMLIKIERSGVAIQRMRIASKHTFLAGIVPMFLLFGASGAARGVLEALRSGEIARLMAAPIAAGHVLVSGLLSSWTLAMTQCYAMYVYAWLVFNVAIWDITFGLLVLTVATCLATTGFGVLLGAVFRSTEQVDSIGTIVILAMSAVGGSMVPRFVMPPFMQTAGLFTINGWAYDGFIALIRNEGLPGIAPSCGVLVAVAAACTAAGVVLLARRFRSGVRA